MRDDLRQEFQVQTCQILHKQGHRLRDHRQEVKLSPL